MIQMERDIQGEQAGHFPRLDCFTREGCGRAAGHYARLGLRIARDTVTLGKSEGSRRAVGPGRTGWIALRGKDDFAPQAVALRHLCACFGPMTAMCMYRINDCCVHVHRSNSLRKYSDIQQVFSVLSKHTDGEVGYGACNCLTSRH